MKKIINIIITVIILTLIIVGLLVLKTRKTNTNIENEIDGMLLVAANLYFNDTETDETSIWALIENKYYVVETEEAIDKCQLLSKSDNNTIIKNTSDCEKAEELAKKPIIIVKLPENFSINSWNTSGGEIAFSIRNAGNSYYSFSDITFRSLIIDDEIIGTAEKLYIPDSNFNSKIKYIVEFKNGEMTIEKEFYVLVDVEKPVLNKRDLNYENFIVEYNDNNAIKEINYTFTTEEIVPDKEGMKEITDVTLDFECGQKYYVWTYAKDIADNETDVELAGSFVRTC